MKYLILYSYYETSNSIFNLNFFIKNALSKNTGVNFIFLINSNKCSVNIPTNFNVKIIKRNNSGLDFGAWSDGLKQVDINDYDNFIFINDTVIGPFLPRYIKNDWYVLFCNLLDSRTKLSGLTINYKPFNDTKLSKHVQSMMFCTDKVGLTTLISKKIFLDTKYNSLNKLDYIINYEIGMSKIILESGYQITALALSENKKHNIIDVWFFLNKYFNMNINPLETIFYKNNRIKTPIYNLYISHFF